MLNRIKIESAVSVRTLVIALITVLIVTALGFLLYKRSG